MINDYDEELRSFNEAYDKDVKEITEAVLYERFNKLWEEESKVCVLGFGRLNPPTIGHQKLIDTIKDLALQHHAEARMYLSHTQDKKKNPLNYDQKLNYCELAFGDVIKPSDAKTIIDAFKEVYADGFNEVIYVGGEDRIGGDEDVSSMIMKYNGVPNKKGEISYDFGMIRFVNAGHRDDNSNNPIEKASASLVRQLAAEGKFDEFKQYVPLDENEAKNMYNDVRAGLGLEIEEELINEAPQVIGKVIIDNKEYDLKDNYEIKMGPDHYYSKWKDKNSAKVTIDSPNLKGTDNNASIGLYHNNRVKFSCNINGTKKVLNGVQGAINKGFESEESTLGNEEIVNSIINDYTTKHPGAKIEFINAETLHQNPPRLVEYKTLFEVSNLYKPDDEEQGKIVADAAYYFKVNGKEKTFYVSNKYGTVHTPINLGINKIENVKDLLSPIMNINTLSKEELNAFNIWWSTRSSRDNIALKNKKTNEVIYSWHYIINDGIKEDNLINYLANQYASGYYYVIENSKGEKEIENIDDKVKSIREGKVNLAYITLTHSMVCINVSITRSTGQIINTEIDLRRKGSTNYSCLSKQTSQPTVKRGGEEIDDLNNYEFIRNRIK